MNIDYKRISSIRTSLIEDYKNYCENNGIQDEDSIYNMPVKTMVGYFLLVHSKNPMKAVRMYLQNHTIDYNKANQVKMLISILS